MARVTLVGQPIPVNDNKVVITVEAEGVKLFGVANVAIYSINKETIKQEEKKPTSQEEKKSTSQEKIEQPQKNQEIIPK